LQESISTGNLTEMGKIGKALKIYKDEPTILQKKQAGLIKNLLIIGGYFGVVIVIVYG